MVNINLRTYYTAIELIRNFVNNKTIDKDFFNEKFMKLRWLIRHIKKILRQRIM